MNFIIHYSWKNQVFFKTVGSIFPLIESYRNKENITYNDEISIMVSIEDPVSIKNPNKAVPNAVEKTIVAVVNALIEPIYLTP